MATLTLPALQVPTRDQIRDRYLRDYQLRLPEADVSENTQPWIDASTFADQMTGLYALAQKAAARVLVRQSTGVFLDALGEAWGLARRSATGAFGFASVTTSVGGAQLFAGDEVREPKSALRFRVTQTGTYQSGDLVPIAGLDTGPATSLPTGTVLTFTSPRPGLGPTALVASPGLAGGANAESDDAFQTRLIEARRRRPASGNDADYQDAVESTPGVPVEKAFTYPAILGPGTVGVAFTVRGSLGGTSRRPTDTQVATVDAWLRSQMPADDMIFVTAIGREEFRPAARVTWDASMGAGWVDPAPWPPFAPLGGTPGAVVVGIGATATHFTLRADDDIYTGATQPVVGQSIAFYVPAEARFALKRIGAVSGTGPWVIDVDTSYGSSDTSYVPANFQRAMPYAVGMDKAGAAVAAYVAQMGPGEMTDGPVEPGLRQTRQPPSPRDWPAVLGNRALAALYEAPGVVSAVPLEDFDHVIPTGAPGVLVSLGELVDLSLFPLRASMPTLTPPVFDDVGEPLARVLYDTFHADTHQAFADNGHIDASFYARASGMGQGAATLTRAQDQAIPTRATDLLPALEEEYGLHPAASDTVPMRQAALADRVRLPGGATRSNIEDRLRALLGSGFVAFLPGPQGSAPAAPGSGPGTFLSPQTPRKLARLSAPVLPPAPGGVPLPSVLFLSSVPGLERWNSFIPGDIVVLEPDNGSQAERVMLVSRGLLPWEAAAAAARTGRPAPGSMLGAYAARAHPVGAYVTAQPWPYWLSESRRNTVVVTPSVAADPSARRRIDALLGEILRGVSTWRVVTATYPFRLDLAPLDTSVLG